MKGDFSRLTFDPSQRFSRVLLQQGRVLLDADWNEQTESLLRYLRTLAADLIGPHGGPQANAGFEIGGAERKDGRLDFAIGPGRYYVDGLLCENLEEEVRLSGGPSWSRPYESEDEGKGDGPFLVYLEAWEREVTFLDHPPIREVALGGPDTSTRARVHWRVRLATIPEGESADNQLPRRAEESLPLLTADTTSAPASQEPCAVSPESRYRGAENQLYRVEVHRGGEAGEATFKWSRENGSVVFAVRSVAGPRLSLEHLGRDERLSLTPGDWVEVFDERYVLQDRAEELLRVEDVDRAGSTVTLNDAPGWIDDDARDVQVRRWDHRAGKPSAGGLEIEDGAARIEEDRRMVLEDGMEIEFVSSDDVNPPRRYRTGDYWLIPARTATGGIEWPPPGHPDPSPPLGVTRHHAPLAEVTLQGNTWEVEDRRLTFAPLAAL